MTEKVECDRCKEFNLCNKFEGDWFCEICMKMLGLIDMFGDKDFDRMDEE